jgi:hypothetical protein
MIFTETELKGKNEFSKNIIGTNDPLPTDKLHYTENNKIIVKKE